MCLVGRPGRCTGIQGGEQTSRQRVLRKRASGNRTGKRCNTLRGMPRKGGGELSLSEYHGRSRRNKLVCFLSRQRRRRDQRTLLLAALLKSSFNTQLFLPFRRITCVVLVPSGSVFQRERLRVSSRFGDQRPVGWRSNGLQLYDQRVEQPRLQLHGEFRACMCQFFLLTSFMLLQGSILQHLSKKYTQCSTRSLESSSVGLAEQQSSLMKYDVGSQFPFVLIVVRRKCHRGHRCTIGPRYHTFRVAW